MKIGNLLALKITLLFMTLGASLTTVLNPSGLSLSKLLVMTLFVISINLIIIFFYKHIHQFKNIHIYFKFIFFLLIIWSLFTIFRSLNTNSKDMMTLFGHYRVGGLVWMTPFAIFFGFYIKNWLVLFKFIPKILLIGIVLGLISIVIDITSGVKVWLLFFPTMLLTYFYHTKSTQRIIILSILMYIFISFILSQRANILFISLIGVFFIFEYLRNSDISMYKKISFSILLSLSILFSSIQVDSFVNKMQNNKEMSTDTRTFLFVELLEDMNEEEVIIGKGALGTYYSRYFDMINSQGITNGDSANRSTSEVGYLFMFLKGGIVMIVLYLLILLPAAFIGIFKSNNIIARMSGYYILLYLLMWLLTYTPEFLPEFIILWMAVGTVILKSNRVLNNDELIINQEGRKYFASY